MTADVAGLARLSDRERQLLAMLAEGHTAKTIAATTGLSLYAVNERLREARRKTGAGSSRDLARLMASQENRDEKIAMVSALSTVDAATPAPQIVDTFPAAGQQIGAGPFTLSVTFDRAMRPGSYSYVRTDPAAYLDCHGMPQLSADRRTFRYACMAMAGHAYEIGFNSNRFRNFKGADGTPALASVLAFSAR